MAGRLHTMTEYPGTPDRPDDPDAAGSSDHPDDTSQNVEPTVQFNPTSTGWTPEQQQGGEQAPWYPPTEQGYAAGHPAPYPAPPGAAGYPTQGGYPYPGYAPARPNHPQAGLALGLGIGGLIGAMMCILPILLSPFAWAIGQRVRKEIRESNGRLDGDGMALAGMVLGIVGTALLALGVLALIGVASLTILSATSTG